MGKYSSRRFKKLAASQLYLVAIGVLDGLKAAKELPNHEKVNVRVVCLCSTDAGGRPLVRSQRQPVQQS
jgi:hypothetical protein